MDEKTKKLKILDVTIIDNPLPANQSVAHCGNHCGACGDCGTGGGCGSGNCGN